MKSIGSTISVSLVPLLPGLLIAAVEVFVPTILVELKASTVWKL